MGGLGVLLTGVLPPHESHYLYQTLATVVVVVLILAVRSMKRMHWSLVATGTWVALMGVYTCFQPASPFIGYGSFIATAFDSVAAKALGETLLIAWLFTERDAAAWWSMEYGFAVMGCIEAVRIFYGDGFRHNNGLTSFSIWDNQSMGASALAILLPFTAGLSKWPHKRFSWPYFLFVPAIVFASSSVAWAALFVGLAAPLILKARIRSTLQLVVVAAIGGWMVLGSKLTNSDGRFALWRQVWDFWTANVNPWIGSGTGTFELLGPHINVSNGNETLLFIWLHNDWYQILFEQGVVGLTLALTCFGFALYRARRDTAVFATVLTFGFVMLAQMPWRYGPSALFGAFVLRRVLDKKERPVPSGTGLESY